VTRGEVAASLSLATDLATGLAWEHGLRTCALATRLADAAGLGAADRAAAWWMALLHSAGCTSDAHEAAAFYGDDIGWRAGFAVIDSGRPQEVTRFVAAHARPGARPASRAAAVGAGLALGQGRARVSLATHCEVAERFAGRMGVDLPALAFVFERWDGRGLPNGARGDAIPVPARTLHVARDAAALATEHGAEAAAAEIHRRAGGAYEPALAELVHEDWLAALDAPDLWEDVLGAEPGGAALAGEELDGACRAVADFADLKSPWTLGHSRAVSELAEAAAWRLGFDAARVEELRRAALVHDLGRAGVSNGIWDKPGPLTEGERERVRMHPYFTERALARSPGLAPLGELGGAHHERLDGSGYHRRAAAAQLGLGARVLATADVFQAMTEPRPHRPAHAAAAAAAELRAAVAAGRLDGEAADAVLAAAGQAGERPRTAWPAGLTDREVEVLRLLAGGAPNKVIAVRLGVSPKTVGHHVQHLYEKAGVRTRAAATLFALEQGLLRR
jgi:HD-GYP domain-containing protein (c-di-GMP phosphodiesterase class II)/DNA-binding CsgD family transcriptional regulator